MGGGGAPVYAADDDDVTVTQYINGKEYTGDPDEDGYYNVGDEVKLSVKVTGADSNTDWYYWYSTDAEKDEKADGVPDENEGKKSLTVERTLADCQIYICEIMYEKDGESYYPTKYFWLYSEATLDLDSYVTYDEERYDDGDWYDLNFAYGDDLTLGVDAESDLDDPAYEYQWYKVQEVEDEEGGITYNYEEVGTASTLSVTKEYGETCYKCEVTDGNYTDTIWITIPAVETLAVTQYVNDEESKGELCPEAEKKYTLSVTAGSTYPDADITYAWYYYSFDEEGDYVYSGYPGDGDDQCTDSAIEVTGEGYYEVYVTDGNATGWYYFNLNHETKEDAAKAPTCETSGLTTGSHCIKCNKVIVAQQTVAATGHSWNAGVVTKEATATEAGVKTYTCTVCGKTRTEAIAATGSAANTDTAATGSGSSDAALVVGATATDTATGAVYKVTGTNTVEYKSAPKKAKSVTIASTVTLNGVKYKVTSIGAKAFKSNENIKSVVIPTSVKKIGKQAFYGCKNLKKITIRTKSLTKKTIGAKAFKGIHKKAKIKVPKKQLKSYKKLLKARGVGSKAKITK